MRKKDRLGSITIIFITMLFIMIVTSFLSILGLEGQQTIITNNNSLETYLITTNNIFSKEGVKWLSENYFRKDYLKKLEFYKLELQNVKRKRNGLKEYSIFYY